MVLNPFNGIKGSIPPGYSPFNLPRSVDISPGYGCFNDASGLICCRNPCDATESTRLSDITPPPAAVRWLAERPTRRRIWGIFGLWFYLLNVTRYSWRKPAVNYVGQGLGPKAQIRLNIWPRLATVARRGAGHLALSWFLKVGPRLCFPECPNMATMPTGVTLVWHGHT